MSDTTSPNPVRSGLSKHVPDLPLVVWMAGCSIAIGLAAQLSATEIFETFNEGFGRALGEFALILLPSFALAAALARQNITSTAAGQTAAWVSPAAGACMICPDTAYAALSPAVGPYKLALAFGAYSGFKLLYPAGPLIVAAGLGAAVLDDVQPITLLLVGLALTGPVWGSAFIWLRLTGAISTERTPQPSRVRPAQIIVTFAPFLLMAALLAFGAILGTTGNGLVDFLLLPKGALLCAALLAILQTPVQDRRACLDSSVRRTGSLLLVIGAAGAFGAILTRIIPLDHLVPPGEGTLVLLGLFGLTVLFKLAQGSSMATFAAVAPVAAPIVAASGASPVAAVFAICLGSFIAILPNDSYYWLLRTDALKDEPKDGRVLRLLAGTTVVQALVGLFCLLLAVTVLG